MFILLPLCMMLLFMMVSIILWPKGWPPILLVFCLFSLTLLTDNLFTIEKCTELTPYRTNLEGFWITLSDDKSIFKQMSCLKWCSMIVIAISYRDVETTCLV